MADTNLLNVTLYTRKDCELCEQAKKDLESLNGSVKFFSIKQLELSEDIDWPTFDRYVDGIESVSKVLIPKSLTRFQVLTKCRSVGSVVEKS